MKLLRLLLPAFAGLAYACANLPDVPEGTCGNRVIDPNEDCDTFAIGKAACGAPSSDNACRLTCTLSSDCPASWGCGIDGICRAPSGAFTSAFDPLGSGAARLQTGDFDGDGRTDILASSVSDPDRASLYFFDSSGKIATTHTISASMRSPQVVRVLGGSADARDDIAFASANGGVDILLGQSDRTVVPVAYPKLLMNDDVTLFPLLGSLAKGNVPVSGSGAATSIGVAVVVGNVGGGAGISGFTEPSDTGAPIALPAGLAVTSRSQVIDGTVSRVLAGSICGDLVLLVSPNASSIELDIMPICGLVGTTVAFSGQPGAIATAPQRYALTSPLLAKASVGSIAIGDMNGDKSPDIVLNVIGSGGDVRDPLLLDPKTGSVSKFSFTFIDPSGMTRAGDPSRIIATGDLNADGITDFITSDDLVVSVKSVAGVPTYTSAAHTRGDSWTQAVIADFNLDGLLDVAASSESRTDVDFFVGQGLTFLSQGTLATSGVVSRLATGDYDGDGVLDLAIASRPSADATAADVFVAYGRKQGIPDTPARVASFALASDLTSLHTLAVDALAVIGNVATMPPSTTVAALTGDADRFPIAPKAIQVTGQPSAQSALGVLAGPFTSATTTDVIAAAGDPQDVAKNGASLYVATGNTDAEGDLGTFASIAISGKGPVLGVIAGSAAVIGPGGAHVNRYLANTSIPFATGDVDGDGVMEAFIVDGNVTGMSATIKRVTPSGLTTFASAPQRFGAAGKIELIDVDGDGALDLVYVSGFDSVSPGRNPGETTKVNGSSVLTVFFNDGKGTLSTTGVAVGGNAMTPTDAGMGMMGGRGGGAMQTSSTSTGCSAFANPTAIAKVRASAATNELALLTAQCLYIATIDRKGTITTRVVPTLPLVIGYSLATGDLNGDGVDEIAYLDDRSFTVLSQAPVRP